MDTPLASVEHLMKYIWFQDKAINYDLKPPRSQDLAKYYSLNFNQHLTKNIMIETKSILGKFYPYFLNSESLLM